VVNKTLRGRDIRTNTLRSRDIRERRVSARDVQRESLGDAGISLRVHQAEQHPLRCVALPSN
jgi:hypothetical protein